LVSGFGLGSMYGLLALGFYVTYSVSNTVNFAQGSSMMLGAVLCYSFAVTLGWNPVASVVLALVLCAGWGMIVERIAVRPFVRRGSNGWLMATVALGIILENATLFTFGKEPRNYPSGLAVACLLHLLARRTRVGKALLAITQNPGAARLMGIDVERAIAFSYAVST